MKVSDAAKKIVESTYKGFSDGGAYSALAFTRGGWEQATEKMLRLGLTPEQVEQVLRSKAVRWARDAWMGSARYGRYTGVAIMKFLGTNKVRIVNEWCD